MMAEAFDFVRFVTDGDLSGVLIPYKKTETPITATKLGKQFAVFVQNYVHPILKRIDEEQGDMSDTMWQETQNKAVFLKDMSVEMYGAIKRNIVAYMALKSLITGLKECGAMTEKNKVVGIHHEDQRQALQESLNEIIEIFNL